MDALIETKDFYKAYKKMHWDRIQSFSGFGVLGEAEELKDIVELYEAQTVLDYGAGKGWQYKPRGFRIDLVKDPEARINPKILENTHVNRLFGINDDKIDWYDPGLKFLDPHSRLKNKKYDGVICIDVMEHVPLQEIDNVLFNIFTRSEMFIYLTVASMPARKKFSDGTNVHVTIKDPHWWRKRCTDMIKWTQYEGVVHMKCIELKEDGLYGIQRMKFGIPKG